MLLLRQGKQERLTLLLDTLYFPWWVRGNTGGSSVADYQCMNFYEFNLHGTEFLMTSEFINGHTRKLSERRGGPIWVKGFGDACGTEVAFFGLASSKVYSAYNIVGNGKYKTRSYRKGNPCFVASGPEVIIQAIDPGASAIVRDGLVLILSLRC